MPWRCLEKGALDALPQEHVEQELVPLVATHLDWRPRRGSPLEQKHRCHGFIPKRSPEAFVLKNSKIPMVPKLKLLLGIRVT